jgi:predicted O-methyltransferase YrrM
MVAVNRIAHFLNWYVLERSPLGPLLARAASAKLVALSSKCRNTDDYIDLAFNFGLVGRRQAYLLYIIPTQVREELAELAGIVDSLEPNAVLEIGTAYGGTLFLWSRLASSDATVVSVDLPGGEGGGGYPKWKIPFYKSFARDKQRIWLVRGNSHDVNVFHRVRRILGTRQVDFLFVDGDHTYGGVKRDHEMYSPLVRKGGVVAFHDIVPYPLDSGCEVSKFWNELKNTQGAREIVNDLRLRWGGIGLLYA